MMSNNPYIVVPTDTNSCHKIRSSSPRNSFPLIWCKVSAGFSTTIHRKFHDKIGLNIVIKEYVSNGCHCRTEIWSICSGSRTAYNEFRACHCREIHFQAAILLSAQYWLFWESKNKAAYAKKRNKKKKGKKRKEKKTSMLVLPFNVLSAAWEEATHLHVAMSCNVPRRGGVERTYCIKLENTHEL